MIKNALFNTMKRTVVTMSMLSLILFCVNGAFAAPVVFVDNSWDSIQVHNRIAGFILEEGFEKDVEYIFAETMPGLLGLERGDVHVLMEGWVDNYLDWWNEAQEKEAVFNAGKIFPDAPQGWYVPAYLVNGDPSRGIDPLAPDLESVFDLEKYWKVFEDKSSPGKGRLYNGPSGWMVNSVNVDKINAYELDDVIEPFDPGSQSALAAAIAGAYEKGEPILAYYWEPTAIMGDYDMIKLEEPAYSDEVWKKNHGCAHAPANVLILLNKKFAEENPELREFFVKYESSLSLTNKFLAYMKNEGADAEETAIWFLKEFPEEWKAWIPDEERIGRISEALRK